MEDQLFSSQNSDLNNDQALCIDNKGNQISTSVRAQMMLLGPQINYMPDKSHVIVLVSLRCENSRVLLLVSFVLYIIPG